MVRCSWPLGAKVKKGGVNRDGGGLTALKSDFFRVYCRKKQEKGYWRRPAEQTSFVYSGVHFKGTDIIPKRRGIEIMNTPKRIYSKSSSVDVHSS